LSQTLETLSWNLLRQGKFAEAEPVTRECLTILQKLQPNDWRRFNAESELGASLLGQKKYAEAEPLVLKGYLGMKTRETLIPANQQMRRGWAGIRIVQLYEAWSQPEKAAEWKAKLGLTDLPDDVFARP